MRAQDSAIMEEMNVNDLYYSKANVGLQALQSLEIDPGLRHTCQSTRRNGLLSAV